MSSQEHPVNLQESDSSRPNRYRHLFAAIGFSVLVGALGSCVYTMDRKMQDLDVQELFVDIVNGATNVPNTTQP